MNVLLDTNILTRWVNKRDSQHLEAVECLRMLRTSGHVPALVPQNLYEFWVVATRPIAVNGLGMTTGDARTELQTLGPPLFVLLQDERAILPRWQELVTKYDVKGKPAHDARLAAAMIRHGLSHLVTFNIADYSRFTEIIAVSPGDRWCTVTMNSNAAMRTVVFRIPNANHCPNSRESDCKKEERPRG